MYPEWSATCAARIPSVGDPLSERVRSTAAEQLAGLLRRILDHPGGGGVGVGSCNHTSVAATDLHRDMAGAADNRPNDRRTQTRGKEAHGGNRLFPPCERTRGEAAESAMGGDGIEPPTSCL